MIKPTKEQWMAVAEKLPTYQEVMSADKLTELSDCLKVDEYVFKPTMERWDLEWEIKRLEKMLAVRDREIGALRFDVAMLKAELNATRGKKNG